MAPEPVRHGWQIRVGVSKFIIETARPPQAIQAACRRRDYLQDP